MFVQINMQETNFLSRSHDVSEMLQNFCFRKFSRLQYFEKYVFLLRNASNNVIFMEALLVVSGIKSKHTLNFYEPVETPSCGRKRNYVQTVAKLENF